MNVGANRQLIGEFGGQYYTSSSGAWNGDWFKIVAISAAVVTLTTSNVAPASQSISLAQGQEVRGRFSSITVTSGTVVAYNSKAASVAWQTTTTKAGFVSTDYLDWSAFGSVGSPLPSGSTASSNLGNLSTVSTETEQPLFLMQQGVNWAGNFTTGDKLVYSYDNLNIITSFNKLISSVGCQLQSAALGTYTGAMDCYDNLGNLISSTAISGTSTSAGDGSAAFGGVIFSNPIIKKVVWRLTAPTPKLAKFTINRLLIV